MTRCFLSLTGPSDGGYTECSTLACGCSKARTLVCFHQNKQPPTPLSCPSCLISLAGQRRKKQRRPSTESLVGFCSWLPSTTPQTSWPILSSESRSKSIRDEYVTVQFFSQQRRVIANFATKRVHCFNTQGNELAP